MPLELKITTSTDLKEIESHLDSLQQNNPGEAIEIWLSRNLRPGFFFTSRVPALFSAARQRGPLTVLDWAETETNEKILDRFTRYIEGVGAVAYANFLQNSNHEELKLTDENNNSILFNRLEAVNFVRSRRGLLEKESDRSASLTFCSIDPEFPHPTLLGPPRFYDEFSTKLTLWRNHFFHAGLNPDQGDLFGLDVANEKMTRLIFELYQNTARHGAADGKMRFLRLKRHIHYSLDSFFKRAAEFPLLIEHLKSLNLQERTNIFYEVSIVDHGKGIIDHFLETRPDYVVPSSAEERFQLLNDLLSKQMSSQVNVSGAGLGLKNAISAAHELKAFLSLRTDIYWASFEFAGDRAKGSLTPSFKLKPVAGSNTLPKIPGTEFNILFHVR